MFWKKKEKKIKPIPIFKTGDVVKLKSGGEVSTVKSVYLYPDSLGYDIQVVRVNKKGKYIVSNYLPEECFVKN